MILTQEIRNLVTEWGLRDSVIEKDYVLGWLLWGIGADPDLNTYWAFKGGTSLKKCYLETWRFSEDLDFTILPGGPDKPKTIEPIIKKILERVHEAAGIDFTVALPSFKHAEKYNYTEGKIFYRGPLSTRNPARIKLDLSGYEKIAHPTALREISHPYTDLLPKPATIRCYSFEEVFAEKLRAMGERGRPRDLYDIVLLYRQKDLQLAPRLIKEILKEKCKTKGITMPTLEEIQNTKTKNELVSEWGNMLGHQLPILPPLEQFWEELPNIFGWLNEISTPTILPSIKIEEDEAPLWTPPSTMRQWGLDLPLESIRFAAVNHLCIELGYKGSTRIVEPYSLRRTKDGNLILHTIETEDGRNQAHRIDRIERIVITTRTFQPKYNIEFSPKGIMLIGHNS